jgi:hypothetical protein
MQNGRIKLLLVVYGFGDNCFDGCIVTVCWARKAYVPCCDGSFVRQDICMHVCVCLPTCLVDGNVLGLIPFWMSTAVRRSGLLFIIIFNLGT